MSQHDAKRFSQTDILRHTSCEEFCQHGSSVLKSGQPMVRAGLKGRMFRLCDRIEAASYIGAFGFFDIPYKFFLAFRFAITN
jgi:hypothetical protein